MNLAHQNGEAPDFFLMAMISGTFISEVTLEKNLLRLNDHWV